MDTCHYEYYMLTHVVWAQANPAIDGMLCIGCVEQRLGRKLNASDFMDCELNEGRWHAQSARLLHRIKRYKRREKPNPIAVWFDEARSSP